MVGSVASPDVARLHSGEMVFGGALGAYIALAMTGSDLSVEDYANFGTILLVLALSVRAVNRSTTFIRTRQWHLYLGETVKAVLSTVCAAALSTQAQIDWAFIVVIMTSWHLFNFCAGTIDDLRSRLNHDG